MLTEIEDRIIRILQENLAELPPENITTKAAAGKLPSVFISNLKFKLLNAGLVENAEQEKIIIEERFSGNGGLKVFKLKETPLRKSVNVEAPLGTALTERDQFVVNYQDGSIIFLEAPIKGKDNILIKYTSRKSVMTLKTIRLKALYQLEVTGKERASADALAENVIKVLLNAEEEFLSNGIGIKPIGGVQTANGEKTNTLQLRYVFEKELRTEKVVEAMERIEISQKPPVV